jgi:hypothetical protein
MKYVYNDCIIGAHTPQTNLIHQARVLQEINSFLFEDIIKLTGISNPTARFNIYYMIIIYIHLEIVIIAIKICDFCMFIYLLEEPLVLWNYKTRYKHMIG